jgi:hypothetical protein
MKIEMVCTKWISCVRIDLFTFMNVNNILVQEQECLHQCHCQTCIVKLNES